MTGFVGNTVLGDVLVHTTGVATAARATATAVDQHLRSKDNLRVGALSMNLDPIGEGCGGSERPARATVLRDMLVASFGEVIGTIDVSPEKRIWQRRYAHDLMRTSTIHTLAFRERDLRCAACLRKAFLHWERRNDGQDC